VPSNKLFTLLKNLVFRGVLVALGWSSAGDKFFVRYVPQSRYFQSQELDIHSHALDEEQVRALNAGRFVRINQVITLADQGDREQNIELDASTSRNAVVARRSRTLPNGVYGTDYYAERRRNRALIYRLRRRTDEVAIALQHYGDGCLQVIVDVGTADGLMLDELQRRMGPLTFLGIDLSFDLLRAHPTDGIFKLQGDARYMPVKSGIADAVIATAVIEHVPDAPAMLRECTRMLRLGGLLVLTTPEPFMERIASAIGLLKKAGHQQSFKLAELEQLVKENGFAVLEARKFMFSPIGFPAEKTIEKVLRPLGLNLIMANQLLIARRG
jgi:ubiquinone/menaquinone biosynthesis C-methylase UbiE